jgi:hypothetical protein
MCEFVSCGSAQGPGMGCFQNGSEVLGSLKSGEFFDIISCPRS